MNNLLRVLFSLCVGHLFFTSLSCEAYGIRALDSQIAPTMQLRLGFPKDLSSSVYVRRLLNGRELETFDRLLKSYFRARYVSTQSLVLDHQRWLRYQNLDSEQSDQEGQSATVLIRDSIRSINHDVDSETRVYTITFNVTFHHPAEHNLAQITSMLKNDGKNLLKVLKVGLDHVFVSQSVENEVRDSASEVPNTGLAWMLALLALSLSCLFAVLVFRCSKNSDSNIAPIHILFKSRQWRHQRMDDDPITKQEQTKKNMSEKDDIISIISAVDPDDYSFTSVLGNHVTNIAFPDLPIVGASAAQMVEEVHHEDEIVATGSSGSDSLYTSGTKDVIKCQNEDHVDTEDVTYSEHQDGRDIVRREIAPKRHELEMNYNNDSEAPKETATFRMQAELKTQGSLVFL